MLSAAFLSNALSDTIVLLPSDDTAIFGREGEENWNAGLSPQIPSGARSEAIGNAPVRMLIRFDIAAQIPAGSQITKASVRLNIVQTPDGGGSSSTFGFHRMLVPWIEGTILTGRPGGAAVINPGEPTWANRAHPDTPWGAPGGLVGTDFLATPGATRDILRSNAENVAATFSFTDLSGLQLMLDSPSTNFGWMFKSDSEDEPKTARLFTSKDTLSQDAVALARRPTICIEFTPPANAPPADTALIFAPDGSRALTFTREADRAYTIESNTTLLPSDWTLLESVPSSPTEDQFSFLIPLPFQSRQFFRVSAQ